MVAIRATEECTASRSTLEGAIAVYNAGVYINGYVPVDLAMGVFAIRGQKRSTQKAVVGAAEPEAAIRSHQSDKSKESEKFHGEKLTGEEILIDITCTVEWWLFFGIHETLTTLRATEHGGRMAPTYTRQR